MSHVLSPSSPAAARDYRDLVIQDYAVQVADLTSVVCELAARLAVMREALAATWDFEAWLQAELCKAREWRALDVLDGWQQERERRAKLRAEVTA